MRPLGQLLLSKVLETGDFAALLKHRIDPRANFIDPVEQAIFETIREHYYSQNHFGELPSVEFLKDLYPEFAYTPPEDSVESLCEQIKIWTASRELNDLGNRIIEWSEQPDYAISLIRDELGKITSRYVSSRDVNFAEGAQELVDDLRRVRENKAMLGLPYPWKTLNEETMGMQAGDYIVLYGRPKNMKSWVGLAICMHLYLHHNARILIYTREMTRRILMQRLAALMTDVDYRKFRRQTLSLETLEQIDYNLLTLEGDERAILEGTGQHKGITITDDMDDFELGGSVLSLQTKIEQYSPDLVFVDPMYKMRVPGSNKPDTDWTNLYQISHDLKYTANLFNIPILCTNQAKQSAEKTRGQSTNEQAYADALIQDCDMAMRVMRQKDEDGNWELVMAIPAGREIDLAGLVIHGNPAKDFSEKRPLTPEDLEERRPAPKEGEKKKPRQTQSGTSRMGTRFGGKPS